MRLDPEMKILVVDDFSTMRRIVKNLLKEIGFNNFHEADDGATAWPMIQQENYDLIVSDWNMPEVSGLELLKKLRSENESVSQTAFLLITAEAKKGQIQEAQEAGADGYIIKPFTAAVLHEKIQRVFINARSKNELD